MLLCVEMFQYFSPNIFVIIVFIFSLRLSFLDNEKEQIVIVPKPEEEVA